MRWLILSSVVLNVKNSNEKVFVRLLYLTEKICRHFYFEQIINMNNFIMVIETVEKSLAL